MGFQSRSESIFPRPQPAPRPPQFRASCVSGTFTLDAGMLCGACRARRACVARTMRTPELQPPLPPQRCADRTDSLRCTPSRCAGPRRLGTRAEVCRRLDAAPPLSYRPMTVRPSVGHRSRSSERVERKGSTPLRPDAAPSRAAGVRARPQLPERGFWQDSKATRPRLLQRTTSSEPPVPPAGVGRVARD